jgi:hypothetical protein
MAFNLFRKAFEVNFDVRMRIDCDEESMKESSILSYMCSIKNEK